MIRIGKEDVKLGSRLSRFGFKIPEKGKEKSLSPTWISFVYVAEIRKVYFPISRVSYVKISTYTLKK